ncbi:FAD-binding oxidoreductase [bacterium BFN5]|nr:FAD-binding oxidoreductase [bacterium BFN5]
MKAGFYKGLTGEVIHPTDPRYKEARQEWNRAIQKYPLVIVYCFTKTDVRNAICWARKHDIGIRIRSGGHHYEGYSTGNSILVIDVSKMNQLKVDRNRLIIQGGVTNQQVYDLVGSEGYPFPGGTCPTVGVVGYTLGGGWGYSSRYLGLGCDSLLELKLVNYSGKVIKANKECNSDLFWAYKGAGGGNFGVVVSMTFKLPQKVDKVTLVEMYYPEASKETMVIFLDTWQQWLKGLDERMTLVSSVYNSAEEGKAILGRGLFYGTPEEAEQLLRPFAKLEGAEFNLQEMTFLEAMQKVQASYPDSEKFKSTGRFVERQYDLRELENIVDLIHEKAVGSVYAAVSLYALGGQVQAVGNSDTAFYYRNAQYIMGIQSIWENTLFANENILWVQERFKYLETITNGSYVNYPYSELTDYEKAYYGQNAYRLNRINKRYDPYNVFKFPQALR